MAFTVLPFPHVRFPTCKLAVTAVGSALDLERFFVCFVVLMNIFINVTGAGYDEPRLHNGFQLPFLRLFEQYLRPVPP